MKKLVLLLMAGTFFLGNAFAQELKTESMSVNTERVVNQRLPLVEDRPIKNVIFIVGDGTGLAQLYSGQLHLVGKDGLAHFQTMPVTGLSITYAADNLITDSAAGATAYSCGAKTNNGMIGQLPDGRNCKTILEMAEEKGLSTGVVVTSTVTHATPASYAAHVPSRDMQAAIAAQFLHSGMEVILGGGLEYFIPQSSENSKREDERNLVEEFKQAGYEFVDNAYALAHAQSEYILGLFSNSGLPSENRTPTLAEMSKKALSILSKNENGFFLLVEGSQIDWAGHANDVEYALRELADFDAAVKEILDFAVNDGETLVVLTADHETGGMTLQATSGFDEMTIAWTSGSHTGIPVPVMAYGPHAIQFSGWWQNVEIGRKVAELTGWGTLPMVIE